MFQGSENAGKMEHIRLINSSGGLLNGTTHYDITNYFESVPSNALERVLWLEADRMRALKVDDENLRNQRDVVKEEVRVNVMNQPYGGFPWLDLPPVAFRNWPNAHNFYGDFADLDAATLADVQNFLPHLLRAEQRRAADARRRRSRAKASRSRSDISKTFPPQPAASARRCDRAAANRRAPRRSGGKIRPASRHRHRLHRAAARQRPIGMPPAFSIACCTAAAPAASIASWFSKSRSPWKPTAARTIIDTNGPTQMVTRIFHKPEFTAEQTIAAYDEVIREVQREGNHAKTNSIP